MLHFQCSCRAAMTLVDSTPLSEVDPATLFWIFVAANLFAEHFVRRARDRGLECVLMLFTNRI